MMSVSYRSHKGSIDAMLQSLEPVRTLCEGVFQNPDEYHERTL